MALFKSALLGGDPIVSKFEFDELELNNSELNVRIFKDYSEEWADFVLGNRKGELHHGYDIVYGPIADDKVGLQIRKLESGSIDKKEFMNRLKYMKGITYQYFFGSEAAIKLLKKL